MRLTIFLLAFFCFSNAVFAQGSGNTVDFDGTDDYASGNAGDLTSITNDFTMEMWVKPGTTIMVKSEQNGVSDISGTTGNGQRYAV